MNHVKVPISKRKLLILRTITAVSLCASVLAGASTTIHWPIVGDAPLFHYIVFLLDHGRAPYREIIDINMPGTYAFQWIAIHAFGSGPLAWRIFDYLLLGICLTSMIVITIPIDWLAGLLSGALFCLIHFRDGPTHTGQRDLMMTAMLLPACALLLYSWRNNRIWPLLPFGIFVGLATVIKPSGLFFAAAFGVVFLARLRALRPWNMRTALIPLVGFLLPITITALYLTGHNSLHAFMIDTRQLMAYHASLGRPRFLALLIGSFPSVLIGVVLPAVPIFVTLRPWRSWGGRLLLSGTALGVVSYVLQGKGFPYHRYPTEAFLLLGCSVLLTPLLSHPSWLRFPALIGVLAGAMYLAPFSAVVASRYDWRNQDFNQALQKDLDLLGGTRLNDHVQCMDMTAGCLNTLYNMKLLQSTSYLYDCYLFQPSQTPVSMAYRTGFLRAVQDRPPDVYVVTNQTCFTFSRDFSYLQRWPDFNTILTRDYLLVREVTPARPIFWWRHPAEPFSYRIYVRPEAPMGGPDTR